MNSTLPAGPRQSPVRQLIEMGTHPFTLLDRCRRDIVIGDRSVLFMDGEEHRRERQLLMPVFHGERMRSYGAIMREAAERELARWPRRDTVIVRPGLTRIRSGCSRQSRVRCCGVR
jgi:cytochrome P450